MRNEEKKPIADDRCPHCGTIPTFSAPIWYKVVERLIPGLWSPIGPMRKDVLSMRGHVLFTAVLICLLVSAGTAASVPVALAYEGDAFPPGGGGYYLMPIPKEPPGKPFIMLI